MAVNLRLIPAKGMTLPFISYGGSSMISLAYAMGMLLALTREQPRAAMVAPELAPQRKLGVADLVIAGLVARQSRFGKRCLVKRDARPARA